MSVTKGLRFKVLTRDGFTCRYCGRRAPDVVLHVDHVQPESRGGSDDMSNLVAACYDCNMGKMARPLPAPLADLPIVAERPRTVAHPDRCRCGRMCLALDEEPSGTAYYRAFYSCACGEEWRTSWAEARRISAADAAADVGDWNVAWEVRHG